MALCSSQATTNPHIELNPPPPNPPTVSSNILHGLEDAARVGGTLLHSVEATANLALNKAGSAARLTLKVAEQVASNTLDMAAKHTPSNAGFNYSKMNEGMTMDFSKPEEVRLGI